MDIFTNDAFRVREMTDAINVIPVMYGRLGQLGLFADRGLRSPHFSIESKNGILHLVQSSERGSPVGGLRIGKRNLRNFKTERFALESRITPDDISGIVAFGETTVLEQVEDVVAERQEDIRSNLDITREYLRAGAIQGQVLDADGTVLVDLFTEFGVSEVDEDFDFGGTPDVAASARTVKRAIEKTLLGDVMNGVRALCSEGFWDSLMADTDFKDAYKYFLNVQGQNPGRDDVRSGFMYQGITWEEYPAQADVPQEDGTFTTQTFIPAGEARFIPMGTRATFRSYNAPADWMETVNTVGVPFYSMIDARDPKFALVEGQMNHMPICMRPQVLIRGHSTT